MGTPARLRLSLTTLGVLLFGMGLAAVLTWLSVEELYLTTQRENLLAQAELIASTFQDTPLPAAPAEPYSQAPNVLPGIHTRLLGEQGAVLVNLPIAADAPPIQVPQAESAAPIPPGDLVQRPEIQSARRGIPATAVRRVASAENRRVLYAAAPVFAGDGTIAGIVYLATPLPSSRLPADIVSQLIGALLFAAILAGAAGTLLSRRIARPLEGLARAAGAVAEGDLNQQVPVGSDIRELDSLGQAFNHMTANLRRSDQAKNAFIADVTHELRTPLTVINGTIETLEDGAIDDLEGRGPLLESMAAEASRLIRLVNDLLVLTRADAGALNMKFECIDLGKLVQARCDHLSALAAPRRVALKVVGEAETKVWGDADRLTQVLDNLLDNAIRHAPEETPVTVTIQRNQNEIRCTVSDRGAGIPAQHLPFIFERFYRVESSRNRHAGGSGLGLAIVRSLVLAHGGGITADSLEGQGTTITFWLPTNESCPSTA